MNYTFDSENFLARWANNELTITEKQAFEQSEDYMYYQAILEGTDILEVPAYDKENAFEKIKQQKFEDSKVISLFPKWAVGIAASLVALLGLWFAFNNNATTFKTNFGEQLAVLLPDNSEVILNAQSKLEYSEKNWAKERTLSLEGQAYFKVKKGSSFTVNTKAGKVEVLGTKFSVQDDATIFEVICYEGKVKITSDQITKTIVKGEAIRIIDKNLETWSIIEQDPIWLTDRSSFKNVPLKQVLKALEKQYGKRIDATAIDENQRFTGSFTHDNLDVALRTVCESMEINFTFKDENTIVFVNK